MLSRSPAAAAAAAVRGAARSAATAAAPRTFAVPHSDLAYRALLRNLALLAGMRHGRTQFNVLITGIDASGVAARMFKLEPAVRFDVAGDDQSADIGALQ